MLLQEEVCGEALSYATSSNNHLENINLSNNNFQVVAVHIAKSLQQIISLKILSFQKSKLSQEISNKLSHVIDCNKCLEELLLSNNFLSSSTVCLLQALSRISTLKVFNLQGNWITEETGEYFE